MQSKTIDDIGLQFRHETDSFAICVDFTDTKLTIRLKDYLEWVIYSKQYSESDIGKEINRKLDLIDIYSAFSMTKVANSNLSQNCFIFQKYVFGDVVIGEDGQQCYKIESKGKITVFRSFYEKKNKQQNTLTFSSNLVLNKEREMAQMQIFSIKSQIQKRQLSKHFNSQILKINQQKQKLEQKVVNLMQALQKYEKKQKQLQDNIKKTNEAVDKQREQRKQQAKKIGDQIPKIQKRNQQLADQIKKNVTLIDKQRDERKAETKKLTDDLATARKDIDLVKKYYTSMLHTSKIHFLMESPTSKNFKVNNLTNIQFTGNSWNQALINEIIPFSQNYTFKVKIIKTTSRYIMAGVIDITKQKSANTSYNSSNAIVYYFSNGNRFPNMGIQGTGAVQGQLVQICVNLQAKSIKITVNGTLRATLVHDILIDQQRCFVPYVEMCTTGDIVQWCGTS